MRAEYTQPINIKIWFQGTSTSRNIDNVILIEEKDGIMQIRHKACKVVKTSIINMVNVNLIEEL